MTEKLAQILFDIWVDYFEGRISLGRAQALELLAVRDDGN